jgi:hypothetical protein
MKIPFKLKRPGILDQLVRYFTAPPCPPVIFQVASSYVSGIHVGVKERKIKEYVIWPLPSGLVEPHFDRPNFPDPGALSEIVKACLDKLHVSGGKVACLIPETCLKTLVLAFDSLPSSEKERDKLIRWRAKKQMPILPEDARMSFELLPSNGSVKVLASLGRSSVLREYENLFSKTGFDVGLLGTPTLSLLNLVRWEEEGDVIIANIDDDSLSLVAATDSKISFYRNKTFAVERRGELRVEDKVELIVKEIENTIHFVEDREQRVLQSLWLRAGLRQGQEDVSTKLGQRMSISIHAIGAAALGELPLAERTILAPLAGQIP